MATTTELGFRLGRGIERTTRPPIPVAHKWAAAYAPTPERPLLDMSQGVPGELPPAAVREALASAAADASSYGYATNAGELSMREAVVEEMKHVYGEGTDVAPDDLALTAGCNLAFVAVALAIADAGDEMILPLPWYFNHEMTLTMLGMKAVLLETTPEEGFIPNAEKCAALITPKTKAIVLVSPNNPTGAIYPPSLLSAFADLAAQHNIALILDETYRDFVSGAPHSLFLPAPTRPWRATLIHLYSFSKAYCIPGHRLGLVCGAPALVAATCVALDSLQICAPRPPQLALAPLLPALRPLVRASAAALVRRHALFRAVLPPRWRVGAQGGYFAFVRHPFAGRRAAEVCRRLAEERGVVCLPASFFGPGGREGEEDRWIRFAVANVGDEQVRLVCERLEESERVFGWELDV